MITSATELPPTHSNYKIALSQFARVRGLKTASQADHSGQLTSAKDNWLQTLCIYLGKKPTLSHPVKRRASVHRDVPPVFPIAEFLEDRDCR